MQGSGAEFFPSPVGAPGANGTFLGRKDRIDLHVLEEAEPSPSVCLTVETMGLQMDMDKDDGGKKI